MPQYVLNPRGAFSYPSRPIAHRPDTLEGKVIGLIDNRKVNANIYLENIEALLRKRFEIVDVLRIHKQVAGTPASPDDSFVASCAAVVNAFGD